MFGDVSHLLASNPPRRHAGVAVADVDGDQRFEFLVAGMDCPNRVLKWTGGRLLDVAPPAIAETGRRARGIAAGDVDGDGREELFVMNGEGSQLKPRSDRLLKARLDGTWEDLFARPENRHLTHAGAGRSVAAVDRRGVGRYGFFLAQEDAPTRFYEMGQAGAIADLSPALGLEITARARGVLAQPILSDHTDIVCLNENGPNAVFRNRGDGAFEECAAELGLADVSEQGQAITAIDAQTGSGLDLCWGNVDGPHRLMRNLSGAWRDRATPALAFPSAVETLVAADFDNDGNDELFFNNRGEANRLFRLGGGEVEMLDVGAASDADGFGTGAAVCDIDGDGVLELLIARCGEVAQPLGLFKLRSTGANQWMRVRPLTRHGAPARGASVLLEAAGRVRTKGICGGSGYRCQMEPVAHFGLGAGESPGRVQVTWPDGASVVLLNPRANRTITVPYPRG